MHITCTSYNLQAINTPHTHTQLLQDEIKTTGSCSSKTVNDLVTGQTNDIFLYLLLSSNDLLKKAYISFIFFTLAHWGLGPAAPLSSGYA